MKKLPCYVSPILIVLATQSGFAATIIDNMEDSAGNALGYHGQSFTMPVDGTDDLLTTINFYDDGVPTGAGAAYLLASEYLGTPAGLASLGSLATSAPWNGSVWDFSASNVTLSQGVTYWVYGDSMFVQDFGFNGFAGGDWYVDDHGEFTSFGGDGSFNVSGTPVPEPASAILLSLFLSSCLLRRRARP